MKRAKTVFFLFLFSLWLLRGERFAFAHGEAAGLSGEWEPVSAGPVTTWTAPLCGKGKLVAQPFMFFNRTRGAFNANGRYDSLPAGDSKYQFQEQLFLQYGLSDLLEIDAQSTYTQNYIKQGGVKAHSRGFGDSYLFLRYCALEEEPWFAHMALVSQLKLPTGKYQKADPDKLGTDLTGAASGGGSYDLGIGLNLTKKHKPFVFHADALYNFPRERKVDGTKTEYGRYLNYDFGMEYFFAGNFNLMLEYNGFTQTDKSRDGERIPSSDISSLIIAPGIGWSNEVIQALISYQRALTGTNTDANDSVACTFVYTF
ncbi:transporter [bacterium]|nr:MAG: transporter [bacterium]